MGKVTIKPLNDFLKMYFYYLHFVFMEVDLNKIIIMKRKAINEALEKIQGKYIKNVAEKAGFVALDKEIIILENIAKEELKADDELLKDIIKAKNAIIK